MAKSKAKKMRDKMTREGKRNPELNRSLFVFADMETRKTKTRRRKNFSTSIQNIKNDYQTERTVPEMIVFYYAFHTSAK